MGIATVILRGILGLAVLVGIAVLFSTDRKRINWRLVFIGIGLQIVFALIVLKTGPGRAVFETIGRGFSELLGFTFAGSNFIFGPLGSPDAEGALGFIFAFHVLPTIIFFASLMAVLYHYGIVQPLVKGLGWLMAKTLGISGAEALSAAANVFIGQTEAPLVVRPYVDGLTRSELMTLMTGGMATIAGGVLAAYILFLGGDDPALRAAFAAHLLSASIMSAPASIVLAKIVVPELGQPLTLGMVEMAVDKPGANGLEAAATGAADGLKLALNVGAMLLAFLALLALINAILGWAGQPLEGFISRISGGQFESLSLQAIFGFVFAPIAWVLGVPANEALLFGQLLGTKVAVNEFVAFTELGNLKDVLSERSIIIGTYALCGFANFSSIAIQIGGLGGIAPRRTSEIAELGLRAVVAGALASWMTATIAGVLIT